MNKILLIFLLISNSQASPVLFSTMLEEVDLSKSCKSFIKGIDLGSKLIQDDLVNIQSFNDTIDESRVMIEGLDFYHYTDFDLSMFFERNEVADGLFELTDNQGYNAIFSFLKKKPLRSCCGISFKAGLFIAEDDRSSVKFGKHLLRMELSSETNIILLNSRSKFFSGLTWDQIYSDLSNRHPLIESECNLRKLKPIILEESGVDLVSYKDRVTSPDGKNKAWFVLLNSKKILKSSFKVFKH